MILIRRRLPVTGQAGENGIVRTVRMALAAEIPFTLVFAGVDSEVLSVVIECRRGPRRRRMARLA